MIVGFLLGILPVLGMSFLANPLAELAFFGIALAVGPLAMVKGFRHHHSIWPSACFAVGFLLIVLGHVAFGHQHDSPFQIANIISAVGGTILVTGHVINARLMRGHQCSGSCRLHQGLDDPR